MKFLYLFEEFTTENGLKYPSLMELHLQIQSFD